MKKFVLILAGCSFSVLAGAQSLGSYPTRQLSQELQAHWSYLDPVKDTVPGVSLLQSKDLIKRPANGKPLLVAVIDGGIDITHKDLKGVVYVNAKEFRNGKDDDGDGYIDDMNGWNFLGGRTGNALGAQFEQVRYLIKCDSLYAGKSLEDIPATEREAFRDYQQQRKDFERDADYYASELQKLQAQPPNTLSNQQRGYLKYLLSQNLYHYNLNFEPRELIGDDPDNIKNNRYGNADVIGAKEQEQHGSHVAGIVAGVFRAVDYTAMLRILPVRAVPDGDEYDKDVALAIRYAVDKGARVINLSFGKKWSPHADWVYDALRYAGSKDVLVVHAAGNEALNIDQTPFYPNDRKDTLADLCNNVLTIGSITQNLNEALVSRFSNYGKVNVDVFAPGSDIYSTIPDNQYEYFSGTSMAAPLVAGIAGLIRQQYPRLTAAEVKQIIMASGYETAFKVWVPGANKKGNLSDLSVSGKIVNACKALQMASEFVLPAKKP